jgi:UV DNA damage endonuclease
LRIGYPCVNTSLGCRNRTFRLKSYSEERLVATVQSNLECLRAVLEFNASHGLLFFRINSGFVPFASHEVCAFDWQACFRDKFASIGAFIREKGMRVSMHPDQFTLINSRDEEIFRRSCRELSYHADMLDLLGVDTSARIQIHVGGVYGDRAESLKRFVSRCGLLEDKVIRRLAVENDDRNYTLRECLDVSGETGVPVIFDLFHHEVNCSGESTAEALALAGRTWAGGDGLPIVDYSTQSPSGRRGAHANSLDEAAFLRFIRDSRDFDFDLMLEIKDKEKSACRAVELIKTDPRLVE